MNKGYKVTTRRLGGDRYEFTTKNAAGKVVSTVRMSRAKAANLGLRVR